MPCLAVALSSQNTEDKIAYPGSAPVPLNQAESESDIMRRMRSIAAKKTDVVKDSWKLHTAIASLFRVVHVSGVAVGW